MHLFAVIVHGFVFSFFFFFKSLVAMILLLKTIFKNTVSEANCNEFLSY